MTLKKTIMLSVIGIFFVSSVFAVSNTKVRKDSPFMNYGKYLAPTEKAPSMTDPNTGVKNDFSLSTRNPNAVLIDSSSNGYGMVVSTTRPIDNDGDWWTVAYRQYAGVGTTHGQLGSASTDEILEVDDWNVYVNVNSNGNPEWGGGGVCEDGTCAQARYPSVVASEEYPYAIWNEYTAENSTYGGRPYYTYDEFGWDGDAYAYPLNIDLEWFNEPRDQWVGSAQYSYDSNMDMGVINIAYNDWTRNNVYLFHTELIDDGIAIFGSEQNPLNLPAHFGDVGYITSPLMTSNDNGDGAVGVIGIFAGNDAATGACDETVVHSCNHIPIFKLTDDHGATFYGDVATDGYYFIPDNVFDDIWVNQILPNTDSYNGDENGWDVDHCINYDLDGDGDVDDEFNSIDYDGDGEIEEMELAGTYQLEDWWSWYDWDMRVDAEGDIHVIMSVVPQSLEFVHHFDNASGFYYLTCDKEDIANPGEVNTADGWRWSFLMSGGPTWNYDVDGDTYSEIFDTHPNLSFASDDPNVIWAVINMAEVGGYIDEATERTATDCRNWDTYVPTPAAFTNWSMDIWVLKSVDGGSTWSDPANVTNTQGNFLDGVYNGPEEMYPHTPAFSDSDNVYFMYQMPNWEWNEIGDPAGADHMNYVYVAFSNGDYAPPTELSIDDSFTDIIPGSFDLNQNYPNPFNPSTTINFNVPNFSEVKINIYDLNGKLVNTLVDQSYPSGSYNVVWNGDDLNGNKVAAGVYMYNLTSGENSITNKMVLIK